MLKLSNYLRVVSLLIMIVPLILCGQQVDSLRRPDIFSSQVEMFNTMPMNQESIVFLGNSITFWGNWTERFQDITVKNRGVAGDTMYGVLERLNGILPHKPKLIFLMIGINDLAQGSSDEDFLRNIGRIIKRIRAESPSTKLIIQSLLPVNPRLDKLVNHTKHVKRIPVLNQALVSLAKENSTDYIDLYAQFVDEDGYLKEQLTWDGVHLTEEGYRLWMDILRERHCF